MRGQLVLPWYSQLYHGLLQVYGFVPFVQFHVFPRASPSGIHKTALRVQIPYTLETHGTCTNTLEYEKFAFLPEKGGVQINRVYKLLEILR